MVCRGVSVLKKIFLFIITVLYLNAGNITNIKEKIIEDVSKIFVKDKIIKLYVADSEFNDIFTINTNLQRVAQAKYADIILTNHSKKFKNHKKSVCIISTNYRDYKRATAFACAAFFWQKGRPNLILNARIIKKRKIKILEQYERFVE
jgi:hypothetical protein